MIKRKEFMLGAVGGLAFAAALTAGGVIDWPTARAETPSGAVAPLAPSAGRPGLAFAPPQGAPLSFADIFDQVAPAVVQIEVRTRIATPNSVTIPGTPFRFQLPPGVTPPGGEEGEEDEGIRGQGAGSGFFISQDGYIVTNNHVVENAEEITVRLSDERELTATLVGRDEATDLAVIKVEGTSFPFVSFEEEAQPRVGDWVIAVGNPFGLGGTATAGIVSAKSRQNLDQSTSGFVDFLQIDAAINRGNSGGPTFDIYGRVIGVNSAIFSPTGGSVGIGFAIPADVAKSVTDQLMRGGRVERGYVGLGLRTFNADSWEALGQPRDFDGAYVESVTPGGPAAQAGVQEGDLLVGVNGRAVANGTEATRAVGAARPGETIQLEVIRDGRRRTISVRSGTRPSETELRAGTDQPGAGRDAPQAPAEGQAVEGMTVTPLTAALRSRHDIPESVNGLVITNVARGTPAAELGLQAGVVITRVNGRAVSSVRDFQAIVDEAKRSNRPSVLLFVNLGGQNGTVVLRFSAE